MIQSEQVIYELTKGRKPLSCLIPTKHTHRQPLLWTDPKTGKQKALRYSTNQESIFENEQGEHAIMAPIDIKDGMLVLDSVRNYTLVEFMEHHPFNTKNGGSLFQRRDKEAEAQEIIEMLDLEDEANGLAKKLDIDDIEKVGYMIWGNKVKNLASKELRRDVRLYARNNPETFLNMFDNPNEELKALISKALSEGYIQFRKDKTELFWNLSDNKKMITRLPKGKDTDKELDNFMATNDGVEVFKTLEKLMD